LSCRSKRDHLAAHIRRAITIPSRHQFAATLEHISAPVGSFHRAADRVSQRLLADLVWITGLLARPVAKRASEPVNGDVDITESSQALQHGRWVEWLARISATECQWPCFGLGQCREHFEGARGQRNAMFLANLHAAAGDRPYRLVDVDLGPFRADDFT